MSSKARNIQRSKKKAMASVPGLTSKVDQFVEAAQSMQGLSDSLKSIEGASEILASINKLLPEIQREVGLIKKTQFNQSKVLLRVLYYFKQFFTDGGSIPAELDELASLLKADGKA